MNTNNFHSQELPRLGGVIIKCNVTLGVTLEQRKSTLGKN